MIKATFRQRVSEIKLKIINTSMNREGKHDFKSVTTKKYSTIWHFKHHMFPCFITFLMDSYCLLFSIYFHALVYTFLFDRLLEKLIFFKVKYYIKLGI